MTKDEFVKAYPDADIKSFTFVDAKDSPDGLPHVYSRVKPEDLYKAKALEKKKF